MRIKVEFENVKLWYGIEESNMNQTIQEFNEKLFADLGLGASDKKYNIFLEGICREHNISEI